MAGEEKKAEGRSSLPRQLAEALGARRAVVLERLVRDTGLPPEALIDLALEILDLATRKLSLPPLSHTAVHMASARWREVSPKARSELLRRAVQARWKKHRRKRQRSKGSEGKS